MNKKESNKSIDLNVVDQYTKISYNRMHRIGKEKKNWTRRIFLIDYSYTYIILNRIQSYQKKRRKYSTADKEI